MRADLDTTGAVVAVFGGSGFLGRRIVHFLADLGCIVRVAVRHPERTGPAVEQGQTAQIIPIHADIGDESSVVAAVTGADAVINTVGHYVEQGDRTFDAIHGQGALHVARASANAGVKRLVLISGLGADPNSESTYVRARALGERLVREAFPSATILRPSVIFGPDDTFFNRLVGLARIMPVLPLFGAGNVKLQPVFVDDVARAAGEAACDPGAEGKTYELGGPRAYTYKALLQLVLEKMNRRRLLLPVPFPVWELLALAMSVAPHAPLSRDQVILMKCDNVVGPNALSLTDLGIVPTSVEAILPSYRL